MIELESEVLVIGGGPVGLSCAALAAGMGVEVLLVDRKDGVSYYPKARALTARTLEIFRQIGVESQVHAAMPAARTRYYGMGPSLVSPELRLVPFGLGSLDPRVDTPCTGSFCPQDHLEPILEARLREEPTASLRFGTELTAFEQDEDGVTAHARDLADGAELRIRARLLVGADGARSACAGLAGIAMTRPAELDPALTVIFKARLSHLIEPLACVYLLLGDPRSGIGGMVSGVSLARDGEEWSMVVTRLPDWGTELTPANAEHWAERWRELVRGVIGIPELEVEISAVALWWRTATVAERLVAGRVVLAGDSAHLMPPAGGLGMNTGLQDAQNLAWRLAAVVNGSNLSLLADYDRERGPENARAVEAAVGNYNQGAQIDRIWNVPQLGLSLGTQYDAGSFIADAPAPVRDYPYHDYAPSGRPGGRAPHFWLDEVAGKSVLDRFGRSFVLLVEQPDAPVAEAAARLREKGAPVDCCVLGESHGAWRQLYEVGGDGAVLVRPDGFIAWRSTAADAAGLEEGFWRIVRNRARDWGRRK